MARSGSPRKKVGYIVFGVVLAENPLLVVSKHLRLALSFPKGLNCELRQLCVSSSCTCVYVVATFSLLITISVVLVTVI